MHFISLKKKGFCFTFDNNFFFFLVWDVPDFDVEVTQGLRFHGQLTLPTSGGVFEATVSLTDSMQLETRIQFPPLKYGPKSAKRDGKSFDKTKVYLSKDADSTDAGPVLVVNGQNEYYEGYCATIGIEGEFKSTLKAKQHNQNDLEIRLHGSMYKEVQDADVILTAAAVPNATDYQFKVKLI